MGRIGGTSIGNNVFVLNVPNAAETVKHASKKQPVTKARAVTSYDREEASSAGEIVASTFKNFLREPEETELFGFVLDGKTSDQREYSDDQIMERLVGFFRQTPDAVDGEILPATFEAAVFVDGQDADAAPIRALTATDDDGKTTIYLSTELGFKDSLLAAHDAYSDFATLVAERLGLGLCEGDIAAQLSETVSTGRLPENSPDGNAPKTISTAISGATVTGIPR